MIIVAPARPAQTADMNHQGGRLGLFMADPLETGAGPGRIAASGSRRLEDQTAGGGRA